MSAILYDEAIVQKIKSWTADTDIRIFSPSQQTGLFEIKQYLNGDNPVKLPIISISRNQGFTLKSDAIKPLSYDGATIDATIERSLQLNALPIQLQYQIDIFTKYLEEADQYARELLFNLINSPTLDVLIPYNGRELTHQSTIDISQDIIDNSQVDQTRLGTRYCRMTINIQIPDAYMFDVRARNNWLIGGVIVKAK